MKGSKTQALMPRARRWWQRWKVLSRGVLVIFVFQINYFHFRLVGVRLDVEDHWWEMVVVGTKSADGGVGDSRAFVR